MRDILETEQGIPIHTVRHRRSSGLAIFAVLMSIGATLYLPAQASQHGRPTILILGDSLSAGYGLPRGTSWVDLLRHRLSHRDPTFQVINASVSGETSGEGRARLPALLSRWHPFLVILELGGNDGLRALPPSELETNLQAMIIRARAAHACVLLLGIRLPPNYGPLYTHAFSTVYRQVANRTHVPWVPFFLAPVATHRHDMQPDHLHPNARAQPLILAWIWPTLAPLLQPESPCA